MMSNRLRDLPNEDPRKQRRLSRFARLLAMGAIRPQPLIRTSDDDASARTDEPAETADA